MMGALKSSRWGGMRQMSVLGEVRRLKGLVRSDGMGWVVWADWKWEVVILMVQLLLGRCVYSTAGG